MRIQSTQNITYFPIVFIYFFIDLFIYFVVGRHISKNMHLDFL